MFPKKSVLLSLAVLGCALNTLIAPAAHAQAVPATTLPEFIALARAQPDKVSYGTAGSASPSDGRHLCRDGRRETPACAVGQRTRASFSSGQADTAPIRLVRAD